LSSCRKALKLAEEIANKHARLVTQLESVEQHNRDLSAREARAIRLLNSAVSSIQYENASSVLIGQLILGNELMRKVIARIDEDGVEGEIGLLPLLRMIEQKIK
jgi:hypothetical protein